MSDQGKLYWYRVSVRTSTKQYGGTDGKVMMYPFKLELDHPLIDDMEKGDLDVFFFADERRVDTITEVRIRICKRGDSDNWSGRIAIDILDEQSNTWKQVYRNPGRHNVIADDPNIGSDHFVPSAALRFAWDGNRLVPRPDQTYPANEADRPKIPLVPPDYEISAD